MDLTDTLSDNPFDLDVSIDQGNIFWKSEDPDEPEPIEDIAPQLLITLPQKPAPKHIIKSRRNRRKSETKKIVSTKCLLRSFMLILTS